MCRGLGYCLVLNKLCQNPERIRVVSMPLSPLMRCAGTLQLFRCGSEGWGFGDVWGAGPTPNTPCQNPEPICVLPIPLQAVGSRFPSSPVHNTDSWACLGLMSIFPS